MLLSINVGIESNKHQLTSKQVRWIKKIEYAQRQTLPKLLKGFNNTISKVSHILHDGQSKQA
jgi:hypothetical protein